VFIHTFLRIPMYTALDPGGSGSWPLRRAVVSLMFLGLVATVLLVFAGAAPKKPWTALSDVNSLIAPRLYFYTIEFAVLSMLAYYVVFMWRHTTDRHVHFLQPVFGLVFGLDVAGWALWGHSEFIGASIVIGIAMLVMLYNAKMFYVPVANGGPESVPSWSTYVATSLPLSTYAGWLVFEFVLLVNAAFSKDGNSSFANGSTSGPVALLMTVLISTLLWVFFFHDFHVGSIIWLALIPTYHASLSVQNKYTNVCAALFFGYLGFSVCGLVKRFMGSARRFYICSDVCLTIDTEI
jgi:hypothetical protein